MSFVNIPTQLTKNLSTSANGQKWLQDLPNIIESKALQWQLALDAPFETEVTGSWVARCSSPHGPAVLKIGFPHHEANNEIDGLLAWNGDFTVKLIQHDKPQHVLLLESCTPGTSLRKQPAQQQDVVITHLCQMLWQTPAPTHVQDLASMIERWCQGAEKRYDELRTTDESINIELASKGLTLLRKLSQDKCGPTLLATDLHAGNVLSSERREWLVIDPKPHIGDRSYDLTQHILNIKPRLEAEGTSLIESLANLANIDAQRLLGWTFGRLCINPKDLTLAGLLAPLV